MKESSPITAPVFTFVPNCSVDCRGTEVWEYACDDTRRPTVFSLRAVLVGAASAAVKLSLAAPDGSVFYESHEYDAAVAGREETREWRLPPTQVPGVKCRAEVTVPKGGRLDVRSYGARYDGPVKDRDGAAFAAHLGFFGAAPENTLAAYEAAGICGFSSCICTPKRTKDGRYVCIHDMTLTRTAVGRDGSEAPKDLRISDMSYAEVRGYDAGVKRNGIFAGAGIPLLEECFAICAKYGMAPYFSIHPDFSREEWLEIGALLDSFGLRSVFRVKSNDPEVLENVFGALGNTIGGYTLWDRNYSSDMPKRLLAVGADFARLNGTIEALCGETGGFTREQIAEIESFGFQASALSCWAHHTGRYFRAYAAMGVKEFTEDYHCSFGLNW